jgi:RNA polymerase sigma factor (sigma-70 family)
MDRAHDQEAVDPARLIVELVPILNAILRRLLSGNGTHHWRHQQTEDHLQNILLLLIDEDYRRLRTYDRRCSPNAWLKTVAKHYLADYFRCQVSAEDWSEVLSGAWRVEASQEEEMIHRERLEQARGALGQLSDQERLLGDLLRSDSGTWEIALALKIEPRQVRKRRYELIKKLRSRLAEGAAVAEKK